MKPWMKTAWPPVVAVAIGGALGFAWGFSVGFGVGSEAVSYMGAQSRVAGALGRIDASVQALNKNDLAYSTGQHQRDLSAALLALGADAPVVQEHWQCKTAERAIIGNASDYLKAHPEIQGGQAADPKVSQALKFCQP